MSDLFGNHIVGFPTRRLKYRGKILLVQDTILRKSNKIINDAIFGA